MHMSGTAYEADIYTMPRSAAGCGQGPLAQATWQISDHCCGPALRVTSLSSLYCLSKHPGHDGAFPQQYGRISDGLVVIGTPCMCH